MQRSPEHETIPDGWQRVRLGDVARERNLRSTPRSRERKYFQLQNMLDLSYPLNTSTGKSFPVTLAITSWFAVVIPAYATWIHLDDWISGDFP